MDLVQIYYFAGLPLLAGNVLFYSITLLSTSITSSQNVFKFIYDHKDTDYIIYKHEIESLDLLNKLKIVYSLILDIFKQYSKNNEEYENLLGEIKSNQFIDKTNGHIYKFNEYNENDFVVINDIKLKSEIITRISEPLFYSIISTLEIVNNIFNILNKIQEKIFTHQKYYFKNIIKICLKNELNQLRRYNNLFDIRLKLLLDIIKIYIPTK